MGNFDPVAATNAYLAALPPAGHEKALHYTQGGHWLILWGFLVSVTVSVILIKWGVLGKIQAGVEKSKPRPWLASWLVAMAFMALSWILTLPWSSYADWWRPKSYGLQNQTWPAWAAEAAIGGLIAVIVGGIFLAILYWVIRRMPRLWPVLAGGLAAVFVLFAMTLAPIFIEPIFNKYTPAPPGPVRDLVVEMGHQVKVPTDKIFVYNGSKQSNAYTANVSGMAGTARVAMSDTMFAKGADQAEVKGVVGHEMGHYVHQHGLWFAAFLGVLIMVEAWLIQMLFPVFQRWLGATSVTGISDPVGLPVLAVAFGAIGLIATPIQSSMSRFAESDADSFSLQNFNEPDGLAKALVKTIEYRYDSPSKLEEVMFYDHPSVRARVQKAMDWKAAHMKPEAAPAPAAAPAPSASPPASSAG